jgi:hypothetical protein
MLTRDEERKRDVAERSETRMDRIRRLNDAENADVQLGARLARRRAEREAHERECIGAIAASPAFRALRAREAHRAPGRSDPVPDKNGMLRKVVRIGGSETTLTGQTKNELAALEQRVYLYHMMAGNLGGVRWR